MPLPHNTETDEPSPIDRIEELVRLTIHAEGAERDAAFTKVFEACYSLVTRDIQWRVRDVQTAEDLAQEVWIKVARSLHTYAGRGGGFISWLLTIARNTVVEYHRKHGKTHETLSPDMFMLSVMPTSEISPAEYAERRDLAERVAACISRLPKASRDVLRLRFFDGLTCEEAAGVMGKTPGAVRVQQHRALIKLAGLMPEVSSRMAEYLCANQPVRDTVTAGAGA